MQFEVLSGGNKLTVTIQTEPAIISMTVFPDTVSKEEFGKAIAQELLNVSDTPIPGVIMNVLVKQIALMQGLDKTLLDIKRYLLAEHSYSLEEIRNALEYATSTS